MIFLVSCRGAVGDPAFWTRVASRFDCLPDIDDDRHARHHLLVAAATAEEATALAIEALGAAGRLDCFSARERVAGGAPGLLSIGRETPGLGGIGPIGRTVISALLAGGKPTWILAADPELPSELADLRGVLSTLELRGVLHRIRAARSDRLRAPDPVRYEDWWEISPDAWPALLCHSPRRRQLA